MLLTLMATRLELPTSDRRYSKGELLAMGVMIDRSNQETREDYHASGRSLI